MARSKHFQRWQTARPDLGRRRGGYLWIVASLLLAGVGAGAVESGEFKNSLGMEFREVRGTGLRFSIWETRVRDWEAYLTTNNLSWDHRPAFSQEATHPAVNITLAEALAFCAWLTQSERAAGTISPAQRYRLPENWEWEAAAGLAPAPEGTRLVAGGDPDRFPWGRDWPPPRGAGNYNSLRIEGAEDDGFRFTAPAGRFGPSPDGLYDLGGNAWEWTSDPASGAATLRGGSWMHWRREFLAASCRLVVKEGTRNPGIGFRCVLEDAADSQKWDPSAGAEARARRLKYLQKPEVTTAEAREAELQRKGVAPGSATEWIADSSVAAPGKKYENSLNMILLPLPGRQVLLGQHEVRIADYRRFVLAGSKSAARDAESRRGPEHPVSDISWSEAKAFCVWLTERERALGDIPEGALYRLPEIAEWRAAASATPSKEIPDPFVWGSSWPPPPGVANIQAQETRPVMSFPPGPNGFYDLAGNVAEWCEDALGGERLVSGGSWMSRSREDLLITADLRMPAELRSPEIGFRILLEFAAEGDDPR